MALTNFFLQPFNKKFVAKSPVTMPRGHKVPTTLLQGYWAIEIDFQHGKVSISDEAQKSEIAFLAYYHVAIDPSHTKYLCFVWNGKIYQFKVLSFGVKKTCPSHSIYWDSS